MARGKKLIASAAFDVEVRPLAGDYHQTSEACTRSVTCGDAGGPKVGHIDMSHDF